MKNNNKKLKKVTHILDETRNIYLPVIDKIKNFRKKSKKSSAVLFKKSRTIKKKALKKFHRQSNAKNKKLPIPGGVGYGVYYKQDLQWGFSNFSCLDFCILTPALAGGDSSNFLYLTATNGTAKGVEALISYNNQLAPEFKIFDWSKPQDNRWSISVPCSSIPENFSTVIINGINHPYCRVLNRTEMIADNVWENKVCLFNFNGNNWDLVYSYQYSSTLNQQKDPEYGSWGPIVETFQEVYTDLNPMGFSNSLLYNDKSSSLLKPSNSTIRNDDNDGVEIAFKISNHTFYIT